MTNDSIKLARLWSELHNVKSKLDNEMLPVSGYLNLDDSELTNAMEQLSEEIGRYLEKHKLTAEPGKGE